MRTFCRALSLAAPGILCFLVLLTTALAWAPRSTCSYPSALTVSVSSDYTAAAAARRTTTKTTTAALITTRLYSTTSSGSDSEKQLRNAIASRNEQIANEEQYAVADGENLYSSSTAAMAEGGASSVVSKEPVLAASSDGSVHSSSSRPNTVSSSSSSSSTATPPSAPHDEITDDKNSLAYKMQRLIRPRAYPLFLAEKAAEFVEASLHDVFGKISRPAASYDSKQSSSTGIKERLVILGTGWGGASLLKTIDTDLYDVTIISPRVSTALIISEGRMVRCFLLLRISSTHSVTRQPHSHPYIHPYLSHHIRTTLSLLQC
jgi:hypothetical protein